MNRLANDRPNVVYRMWDAEGALLYVGLTCDLPVRLATHAAGKPWWTEVASISLEHFPCRCTAADAESLAIREEQPRYNRAGILEPSQPWTPQLKEF